MTPANRVWLWSQAAVLVLVLAAIVVGLSLTLGETRVDNTLVISINSLFFGPGVALSLALNQAIIMLRKPRIVTLGERILLSCEFLAIGLLLISSFDEQLAVLAILSSLLLIPAGLAVLILILVNNNSSKVVRMMQPDANAMYS